MLQLLQAPQCGAPCFWGIIPGQTTVAEGQMIFGHLGIQLTRFLVGNIEYYSTQLRFESGLSVGVAMPAQDHVISTITVNIQDGFHSFVPMIRG
jgi:hypothetical protein